MGDAPFCETFIRYFSMIPPIFFSFLSSPISTLKPSCVLLCCGAVVLYVRMFYARFYFIVEDMFEVKTSRRCCRWKITCYQQINIFCLFSRSSKPGIASTSMYSCAVSVSWMFFRLALLPPVQTAHIHSQKSFIINGIS